MKHIATTQQRWVPPKNILFETGNIIETFVVFKDDSMTYDVLIETYKDKWHKFIHNFTEYIFSAVNIYGASGGGVQIGQEVFKNFIFSKVFKLFIPCRGGAWGLSFTRTSEVCTSHTNYLRKLKKQLIVLAAVSLWELPY